MANYSKAKSKPSAKRNAVSAETQEEAMKIARGTQKPGQTKEQTKLIAQGIQKGIDQYKKQHKSKVRELDKQRKKRAANSTKTVQEETGVIIEVRQHWLPWGLLALSWIGFVGYLAMN